MFNVYTQIAILLKLALLCFAVAIIGNSPASADSTCGGNGQEGCGWTKKCDAGHTKYKGVCRNWGRANKKPWPAKRIGFRCVKNYAPLKVSGSWKCKPCGKSDGQPPCENGRIPFGCGNKLVEKDGVCTACGGRDQAACPKLEFGYPCTGKLEPDSAGICRSCGGKDERSCRVGKKGTICNAGLGAFNGYCKPCGQEDERACPALERGRQCAEWTTETNGYCKPCGTADTQACKVTDKGKACKEGYAWQLNGTCKMTKNESMKIAAKAYLNELGGDTIMGLISTTGDAGQDEEFFDSMETATADDLPPPPASNGACPLNFQSYTAGVAGGASLIKTFSGDAGGAFKCGGSFSDAKWYSSGAHGWTFGAEVEAGIVMGWWNSPPAALRGRSWGVIIDFPELASFISILRHRKIPDSATKIKKVPVDPVVAIGVWFEEPEDGVEAKDINWKPQGVTIMIGAGAGYGLGIEYVKAKTVQICGYEEDDCALQRWGVTAQDAEDVKDGDFDDIDNIVIDVTERATGYILVDMYKPNEAPELGVKFDRDTWTDKRDYKREVNGETTERICFRRNFEFLRYRASSRDCDDGTELTVQADLEGGWTRPGVGFFGVSTDDDDDVAVHVHDRTPDELTVDIYEEGESPRLGLVFTRHTKNDRRDFERIVGGETVERLCFRDSFTELRFRDSKWDCSWGKRMGELDELPDWVESSGGSAARNRATPDVTPDATQDVTKNATKVSVQSELDLAGGLWMFEVQGNKFYLKVVEQFPNEIIVQRANSSDTTTYSQTSPAAFVGEAGQRLLFQNEGNGLWVSADGSRRYQIRRVN